MSMQPDEAFAAFLQQCIMEDGMVVREEQDALVDFLSDEPRITRTPKEVLAGLTPYEQESNLLDVAAQALPSDWRQPLLRSMVRLMWTDDDVAEEEVAFLHDTCKRLGLSKSSVNKLIG